MSCTNTKASPGESMHLFPKDETVRIQWLKFDHKHRPDFNPTKSLAVLCFGSISTTNDIAVEQEKPAKTD